VFVTVALALFTLGLMIYTAKLWGATKKLMEGARDATIQQLRAYISIETAEITGIGAGQTPVATLVIKNCGQTPAYALTQMGGIALGTSFDTLPPPTGPTEMTNASLSPGASNTCPHQAPIILDAALSTALQTGSLTLWVYGEIRYRDAFNMSRFKRYRYMIGGHVATRGKELAICEEGNEED